jgi:hypothetical protein
MAVRTWEADGKILLHRNPANGYRLVTFYPGRYDGLSLRLFRKIKSNNYYSAFMLVP